MNLQERKEDIWSVGQQLFNEIVRYKYQNKTDGIQIVATLLSRGSIFESSVAIGEVEGPSDKTKFMSIAKMSSMITNNLYSSSAEGGIDIFGAIAIDISVSSCPNALIAVSVAGFEDDKDSALISLITLAVLLEVSAHKLKTSIEKRGGVFPKEFDEKGNYMYNIIQRYTIVEKE